jgi:hypothetical protein
LRAILTNLFTIRYNDTYANNNNTRYTNMSTNNLTAVHTEPTITNIESTQRFDLLTQTAGEASAIPDYNTKY